MNVEEFREIFIEEADKNNIYIDKKVISKFYTYMIEILEWNNKVNLTSITDERMFIVKHFIDSLTINGFIQDKETIIDIGTGAGFPGIPLKIVNEDKKITVVDSINKKLNVIRSINNKMNLKNLDIIHSRAEDLARRKEFRENFDVVTTRAVSNFSTIIEYMLPFLKVSGIAICMKGPNYEDELRNGKKAINILGGKLVDIKKINVDNELTRNIILIKKIKKTPEKFPRGQGKALKEPIT